MMYIFLLCKRCVHMMALIIHVNTCDMGGGYFAECRRVRDTERERERNTNRDREREGRRKGEKKSEFH